MAPSKPTFNSLSQALSAWDQLSQGPTYQNLSPQGRLHYGQRFLSDVVGLPEWSSLDDATQAGIANKVRGLSGVKLDPVGQRDEAGPQKGVIEQAINDTLYGVNNTIPFLAYQAAASRPYFDVTEPEGVMGGALSTIGSLADPAFAVGGLLAAPAKVGLLEVLGKYASRQIPEKLITATAKPIIGKAIERNLAPVAANAFNVADKSIGTAGALGFHGAVNAPLANYVATGEDPGVVKDLALSIEGGTKQGLLGLLAGGVGGLASKVASVPSTVIAAPEIIEKMARGTTTAVPEALAFTAGGRAMEGQPIFTPEAGQEALGASLAFGLGKALPHAYEGLKDRFKKKEENVPAATTSSAAEPSTPLEVVNAQVAELQTALKEITGQIEEIAKSDSDNKEVNLAMVKAQRAAVEAELGKAKNHQRIIEIDRELERLEPQLPILQQHALTFGDNEQGKIYATEAAALEQKINALRQDQQKRVGRAGDPLQVESVNQIANKEAQLEEAAKQPFTNPAAIVPNIPRAKVVPIETLTPKSIQTLDDATFNQVLQNYIDRSGNLPDQLKQMIEAETERRLDGNVSIPKTTSQTSPDVQEWVNKLTRRKNNKESENWAKQQIAGIPSHELPAFRSFISNDPELSQLFSKSPEGRTGNAKNADQTVSTKRIFGKVSNVEPTSLVEQWKALDPATKLTIQNHVEGMGDFPTVDYKPSPKKATTPTPKPASKPEVTVTSETTPLPDDVVEVSSTTESPFTAVSSDQIKDAKQAKTLMAQAIAHANALIPSARTRQDFSKLQDRNGPLYQLNSIIKRAKGDEAKGLNPLSGGLKITDEAVLAIKELREALHRQFLKLTDEEAAAIIEDQVHEGKAVKGGVHPSQYSLGIGKHKGGKVKNAKGELTETSLDDAKASLKAKLLKHRELHKKRQDKNGSTKTDEPGTEGTGKKGNPNPPDRTPPSGNGAGDKGKGRGGSAPPSPPNRPSSSSSGTKAASTVEAPTAADTSPVESTVVRFRDLNDINKEKDYELSEADYSLWQGIDARHQEEIAKVKAEEFSPQKEKLELQKLETKVKNAKIKILKKYEKKEAPAENPRIYTDGKELPSEYVSTEDNMATTHVIKKSSQEDAEATADKLISAMMKKADKEGKDTVYLKHNAGWVEDGKGNRKYQITVNEHYKAQPKEEVKPEEDTLEDDGLADLTHEVVASHTALEKVEVFKQTKRGFTDKSEDAYDQAIEELNRLEELGINVDDARDALEEFNDRDWESYKEETDGDGTVAERKIDWREEKQQLWSDFLETLSETDAKDIEVEPTGERQPTIEWTGNDAEDFVTAWKKRDELEKLIESVDREQERIADKYGTASPELKKIEKEWKKLDRQLEEVEDKLRLIRAIEINKKDVDAVKKVYPEAEELYVGDTRDDNIDHYLILEANDGSDGIVGEGPTEALAWADAAAKLKDKESSSKSSKSSKPEPTETKELPPISADNPYHNAIAASIPQVEAAAKGGNKYAKEALPYLKAKYDDNRPDALPGPKELFEMGVSKLRQAFNRVTGKDRSKPTTPKDFYVHNRQSFEQGMKEAFNLTDEQTDLLMALADARALSYHPNIDWWYKDKVQGILKGSKHGLDKVSELYRNFKDEIEGKPLDDLANWVEYEDGTWGSRPPLSGTALFSLREGGKDAFDFYLNKGQFEVYDRSDIKDKGSVFLPAGESLIFDSKEDALRYVEQRRQDIINKITLKFPDFAEGSALGAVRFIEDNRAVIHAFEQADFGTAIHELGHIIRRDLPLQEQKVLESHYGIKDHTWTVKQEEAFVKDMTRYLLTEKAPSSRMEYVFERLKHYLKNIYNALTFQNRKISPRLKQVFDRAFGGDFKLGTNKDVLNSKIWYHGTNLDNLAVKDLDPAKTKSFGNLFGQGIYLTENPNIALGYAEARADNGGRETIYRVALQLRGKVLNLDDKSGFTDLKKAMQTTVDKMLIDLDGTKQSKLIDTLVARERKEVSAKAQSGKYSVAEVNKMSDEITKKAYSKYHDLQQKYLFTDVLQLERFKKNIQDIFDNEYSNGQSLWRAFQEVLDSATTYSSGDPYARAKEKMQNYYFPFFSRTLKKMGYDALTHTGGQRTSNDAHQVVILLDPNDMHSLSGRGGNVLKFKPGHAYTDVTKIADKAPAVLYETKEERSGKVDPNRDALNNVERILKEKDDEHKLLLAEQAKAAEELKQLQDEGKKTGKVDQKLRSLTNKINKVQEEIDYFNIQKEKVKSMVDAYADTLDIARPKTGEGWSGFVHGNTYQWLGEWLTKRGLGKQVGTAKSLIGKVYKYVGPELLGKGDIHPVVGLHEKLIDRFLKADQADLRKTLDLGNGPIMELRSLLEQVSRNSEVRSLIKQIVQGDVSKEQIKSLASSAKVHRRTVEALSQIERWKDKYGTLANPVENNKLTNFINGVKRFFYNNVAQDQFFLGMVRKLNVAAKVSYDQIDNLVYKIEKQFSAADQAKLPDYIFGKITTTGNKDLDTMAGQLKERVSKLYDDYVTVQKNGLNSALGGRIDIPSFEDYLADAFKNAGDDKRVSELVKQVEKTLPGFKEKGYEITVPKAEADQIASDGWKMEKYDETTGGATISHPTYAPNSKYVTRSQLHDYILDEGIQWTRKENEDGTVTLSRPLDKGEYDSLNKARHDTLTLYTVAREAAFKFRSGEIYEMIADLYAKQKRDEKTGHIMEIKGNKFGRLDGMFVTKDMHRYLQAFNQGDFEENLKWIHWGVNQFKSTHTFYNPGTQTTNVLSNIVLMSMNGIPVWRLGPAINLLLKASKEKKSLSEMDPELGNLTAFDFKQMHGATTSLSDRKMENLKLMFDKFTAAAYNKDPFTTVAQGFRILGQGMKDVYERSDTVFRIAHYQHMVDVLSKTNKLKEMPEGQREEALKLIKQQAAYEARKAYVDYQDQNSGLAIRLKQLPVIPFFGFMNGITGQVLRLLAEKPVPTMLMLAGLGLAASTMDDEEAESSRQFLKDYQQGKILIGNLNVPGLKAILPNRTLFIPKSVLGMALPESWTRDEFGKRKGVDISKMIPLDNLSRFNEHTAFYLPSWAIPYGPLWWPAQTFGSMRYSAGSVPISQAEDPGDVKLAKWGLWLGQQIAPPIAVSAGKEAARFTRNHAPGNGLVVFVADELVNKNPEKYSSPDRVLKSIFGINVVSPD